MTPTPNLERMEAVARRATQGLWMRSGSRVKIDGMGDSHSVLATVDGKEIIFATVWYNPKTHEGFSDAEHIATFDPPTVLALLSDLRTMAEERDRLREALETFAILANEDSDYLPDEHVISFTYDDSDLDADLGGPNTLLGERFMRAFRQARTALSGLRLSEGGGRISSSSDAQSDAPSAPVTNAAGLLP